MGLQMDESNVSTIHVPSGPSSFSNTRPDYSSLSLQQLIGRKDNLEAELKALGEVLDTHGVNMQSSLTTFDGFPRSDIDVAQVRVTRARIIHLRNDWKDLMNRIEKALHEHHAQMQEDVKRKELEPTQEAEATSNTETTTSLPAQAPAAVPETPFAKVNSVEPGSPANEAGLKPEDLIRRFGQAIWSNHEKLKKVGEEVKNNLGKPIPVRVLRKREVGSDVELELKLTPRQGWGGRGSLGCYITPL